MPRVISIATIRSLAVGLALIALGACTQPPATSTYAPSVGQPGKDVVWVPTPSVLVDTMLDMAKVTRDDFVIDLGSGDGRMVIAAAMRGARALGIEYDGEMVALSRRNALQAGVADRATFVQQDLFESDFSKATVVTMFLLPDINRKLMPRLLSLKPGTRIVSNSFPIGDWTPDQSVILTADMGCETAWCTAMSWVVPARVVGNPRDAARRAGARPVVPDALRNAQDRGQPRFRSRDASSGKRSYSRPAIASFAVVSSAGACRFRSARHRSRSACRNQPSARDAGPTPIGGGARLTMRLNNVWKLERACAPSMGSVWPRNASSISCQSSGVRCFRASGRTSSSSARMWLQWWFR
jgi:hypothetical protein